jgi:hypothetical protein
MRPSGKSVVYLTFVSVRIYYIYCDLPMSITFVSIDKNLYLIDSFSWLSKVPQVHANSMASRQTRRTPHNVYTQKRADREFEDFIQYSQSKNFPIPNGLASPSKKRSQAIDDSHLNALKRQRLAPGQVHFNSFRFFQPSLIMLFISSLS